MIRHFKRYVNHVKRQSQAIKEVHAVLFATLGTACFIFLYLYVSSISSDTDKEGKAIASSNFSSPITLFIEQVRNATEQMKKGSSFEFFNEEVKQNIGVKEE
jgi:hypothetical protein